jgi:glycosyltransferase involved in cell wall biosynthesis
MSELIPTAPEETVLHPVAHPGHGLNRRSSVLAIVPHFRCEEWLGDALASLVQQTRPLDGIVVVDDGSPEPPAAVVRHFPSVTLLAADSNGGPYRLFQTVVINTGYDAYMPHDADDWSSPDRLALLLAEAERSGAEMIGSQSHRLLCTEGEVVPTIFPLDVNAAHVEKPTRHAIMHPSCVVSRDLILRAGGYASGLKFGGDTEFEHRATHVGRIVNIPHFAYMVRRRPDSLVSSPETGLDSASRKEGKRVEFERALANAARVAKGKAPDLTPQATANPVPLRHIAGPLLRSIEGGYWP